MKLPTGCHLCIVLAIGVLGIAALVIFLTVFAEERWNNARDTHLGPFCSDKNGHFQCKPRTLLCGCASRSCMNGDDIDWDALRNLNFTDGVVRMATFRQEMKIPGVCACPWKGGPRVDSSWLIRFLGGTVETKTNDDGTACTPCTQAPTHAWNEIELPHSNCYLMLGGQTSAFRDRGIHAFRLVLHDTTWRFWEREPGKLAYDGLLLHRQRPLSRKHAELLMHLISHGARRDTALDFQFERSLDQGHDLSPIFLEFLPATFLFKDDALPSMVAAYFGLFGLYRLLPFIPQAAVNCVVVALLFGRDPQELLRLVPKESHDHIRAHARSLNEFWHRELAPIFQEAGGIFKQSVELDLPETEKRRWCPIRWQPRPATKVQNLGFQEQVQRFRPAYFSKVLSPLKRALLQYDAELAAAWSRKFALADELLEYRLDAVEALKAQTSEGCEAESVVDQLLFCPDWRKTRHWKKHRKTVTPATVVMQTDSAVRSLLYWNAVRSSELPKGA